MFKKIHPVVLATILITGLGKPGVEILSAQQDKDKITIFQFRDRGTTTDYAYYSYIIADSIAVELRRRGGYPVYTHPVSLDYIDDKSTAEKTRDHVIYLSGKGEEFGARFIISGMFYVKNNKITIKSQVFDVNEKKILRLEETRSELGVFLFDIIDRLTAKINSDIAPKGRTESKIVQNEAGIPEKSPFIPLYRAVRGTSIGANHGRMKFSGKWGNIYQDTDLLSFYLNYSLENCKSLESNGFLKQSSVGIQYHAFTSQPENYSTSIMAKALTLDYVYSYPVLGNFRFSLAGGIGLAFTNLKVYDPLAGPGEGPSNPIDIDKSRDIVTQLTLSADYEIHPLIMRTGYTVNRIWYSDVPMDYNAFFISIGYRL